MKIEEKSKDFFQKLFNLKYKYDELVNYPNIFQAKGELIKPEFLFKTMKDAIHNVLFQFHQEKWKEIE